ncbi:MAG: tetratricopeptide repeat protein [Bacteroidota bacterium]
MTNKNLPYLCYIKYFCSFARTILTLSLLYVSCSNLWAQPTPLVDSLRQLYQKTEEDSTRFDIYYKITGAQLGIDSTAFYNSLDTLKQLARQLGGDFYQGRCLFTEARFLKKQGQIELQRQHLEEALLHFQQAKRTSNIGIVHYALAGTWLPEGDYEKAFLGYQSALKIFRQINDQEQEANALNAMGVVQRRAGNLDEAVEYLQQAAALSRELGQKEGEATALLNQAVIHKQRKEYALAEPLYQRGLELAAGPPLDEGLEAYIHNNLSALYFDQKQYEQALMSAEKAYAFFAAQGNRREQAATMLGIGSNLAGLGRYTIAIEKLRLAIDLAEKELFLRKDVHEALSKSFAAIGLVDSALHHLRLSGQLERELADEKRLQALAEVEARYQNKEKQAQIDELAAEDLRKQATIKRRNASLVIGGVALVLLSLLLRSVMKQRTQITTQNKLIQKNLEEKELLMKEIHHRVKNNLQMVSSLLSLQSKHLTESAAVDALQLGKSRVRSMAMIHQQLYTGTEVSTLVDAKHYLEKLCKELISTYRPENTNITLDLDIAPLQLDIDTLVPLGLLVNEATTNATKYAFTGRTEGFLQVILQQKNDLIELHIKDDGPGLSIVKDQKNQRFGSLLMHTLAEQLDGQLERSSDETGTRVMLRFPKEESIE